MVLANNMDILAFICLLVKFVEKVSYLFVFLYSQALAGFWLTVLNFLYNFVKAAYPITAHLKWKQERERKRKYISQELKKKSHTSSYIQIISKVFCLNL